MKAVHRIALAVLIAVAALPWSAAARAEVPMALDRINLSLGGYYASSDALVRVDGDVRGSDVRLERDVGLARERTIGRLRLAVLAWDSQGFEIDGYRLRRHGERSLSRALVYDDATYDVDARVRGDLDIDFASVAWRWWVAAGEHDVWGLGLGGGYYRLRGVLQGDARVNGEATYARTEDSADAWAPLLELGWRHAFSPRLRLYADVAGVEKDWGPVTGHIYNAALGVEWFPWKHLGLGAEYGAQRIVVNVGRSDFHGHVRLDLDGPSMFARLRF